MTAIGMCRTIAEKVLADELGRRGVDFACNSSILVSSGRVYTPDFIIGADLIVEVMGSIHWRNHIRTRDIVRREALATMGYRILEFLNLEVFSNVGKVADQIILEIERDRLGIHQSQITEAVS